MTDATLDTIYAVKVLGGVDCEREVSLASLISAIVEVDRNADVDGLTWYTAHDLLSFMIEDCEL